MQALFTEAIEKTWILLKQHASEFEKLVDVLFKKETLDGSEIQSIVSGPIAAMKLT